MVSNMASGIRSAKSKVTSAISTLASNIRGFIGFSEPEEGPLSNFHTYMPDMIDLMVKGIHDNMGKVKEELENLTTTMSYTINTPDISSVPLSTNITPSNIQTQNIEDAFNKVLDRYNNANNIDISGEAVLKVNGKEMARQTIFDYNNEAIRLGYKPLLQRG